MMQMDLKGKLNSFAVPSLITCDKNQQKQAFANHYSQSAIFFFCALIIIASDISSVPEATSKSIQGANSASRWRVKNARAAPEKKCIIN